MNLLFVEVMNNKIFVLLKHYLNYARLKIIKYIKSLFENAGGET